MIETNSGGWQHSLARMRGFVCEKCGKKLNPNWREKDYDIHHIIPFAKGGTHALDNLIVLCRVCHKTEHASKKRTQQGRLPL